MVCYPMGGHLKGGCPKGGYPRGASMDLGSELAEASPARLQQAWCWDDCPGTSG